MFFWMSSDRHQDIIEKFCPHKDGVRGPNSVSVEITPPTKGDWADLSLWSFQVDQDIKPEWFDRQDVEDRTRAALAKRAQAEMPWLSIVAKERQAAFETATSTQPADRTRAEKAAREIAKLSGLRKNRKVVWVNSPKEENKIHSLRNCALDFLRSPDTSIYNPLWNSLRNSLDKSIYISLSDNIYDSLDYSISDYLNDSPNDSLCNSLCNSMYDIGWICLYTVAEQIGVKYSEKDSKLLRMSRELAKSCFAMWLTEDSIILCERPNKVEIVNGKVVDMSWGG